jgi:hypothetical protein
LAKSNQEGSAEDHAVDRVLAQFQHSVGAELAAQHGDGEERGAQALFRQVEHFDDVAADAQQEHHQEGFQAGGEGHQGLVGVERAQGGDEARETEHGFETLHFVVAGSRHGQQGVAQAALLPQHMLRPQQLAGIENMGKAMERPAAQGQAAAEQGQEDRAAKRRQNGAQFRARTHCQREGRDQCQAQRRVAQHAATGDAEGVQPVQDQEDQCRPHRAEAGGQNEVAGEFLGRQPLPTRQRRQEKSAGRQHQEKRKQGGRYGNFKQHGVP